MDRKMSSEKTEIKQNPNLRHNSALYQKRLIWGVPAALIFICLLIATVTFINGGVIAGVIVFLLLVPPLIMLHKDDEHALTILFDKLRRPNFYSAGGVDDKKVKTIKKINSGFEIKDL